MANPGNLEEEEDPGYPGGVDGVEDFYGGVGAASRQGTTTLYGINPSKIAKQDIINTKNKAFGMLFPMGHDPRSGYVAKSSGLNLIKQNLRQLLLTTRGQRVMLPNFGTNLKRYLMEPLDQVLLNQIKEEILETLAGYARNVNVLKLQVIPGEDSRLGGGHYILINLFCSLREQEEVTFELKVNLF